MTSVALKVEGMVCGGCVASITNVLKAKSGVDGVTASLEDGEVSIQFDPEVIQVPELSAAIEAAGFNVTS